MATFRHPISGWSYERDADGLVLVCDEQGREGRFHRDGRWHSGELRSADAHACSFVTRRLPGQA